MLGVTTFSVQQRSLMLHIHALIASRIKLQQCKASSVTQMQHTQAMPINILQTSHPPRGLQLWLEQAHLTRYSQWHVKLSRHRGLPHPTTLLLLIAPPVRNESRGNL